MSFQALTFAPGDPHLQPVKALADRQFVVTTPQGSGVARYFATGSLDEQSTGTTRALINLHGALRNADVYEKTGEEALAAGGSAARGTLLISPQFLAQPDVDGHKLPSETLRWDIETWIDGSPALAPAPLSSFAVLDAILERLADRGCFPASAIGDPPVGPRSRSDAGTGLR